MKKYTWLLAPLLIGILIFTKCSEKKSATSGLQIGQQRMVAMVEGKDSVKNVMIVYRVVKGDSLDGLTFKRVSVTWWRESGIDTLKDASGRPIYDSVAKQFKLQMRYDSVPSSKLKLLSPLNIDSLLK